MKIIQSIKKSFITNKELWICALLGAITFVYIYGVHVLNPTYTDWLLTSEDGDLTQHYLGWKFYRHAGWSFPFGLIDTMAYPNQTSIIFTDSIPLFAFIFKVFRFMLPAEFQYFGWFGLMCFMLQGAVGAKLVKKYLDGSVSVVLGGMFFVLSPVFIDRMYWMTSLAGHFLCLLALVLLVYYDEVYHDTKKAVIAWGVLGVLCAGIHLYFLPMCGIILLGFMLVDVVKQSKKWKVVLPLVSYLVGAAVTVFLFGGFGSGMKAGNDGLGYYSYNLNGLFNPHGWSAYLKDMPYTDSQYEGFAYLGLGVLALLVVTVIMWLGNVLQKVGITKGNASSQDAAASQGDAGMHDAAASQESVGKQAKGGVSAWCAKHIFGLACALIMGLTLFASVSNVVMYHDKVLFDIDLPNTIYKLWSVFRATGRLIWPMVYLLVLGAVCMDGKLVNQRTKGLALALCLLLQFVDIKGMLASKNEVYNKVDYYQTLLPDEAWTMIANETQMEHICFVSDVANSRKLLFSFGDYASDYGLTLSNFYFARSLGEKEVIAREQALEQRPENTIFIFFEQESQKALAYPLIYYKIDGLIVGCAQPLGDLEPMTQQELGTYYYDMTSSRYLNNSEVTAEGWLIHSYGNSYGPYLNASAGRYTVSAEGSGLTAVDVKCYYNGGDSNLEPQNLVVEDGRITFEIELTEQAPDLEVALWNVGGGDMLITNMSIQKQ